MPPETTAKVFDEIEAIQAWINAGAVWPESSGKPVVPQYTITPQQRAFWAFQPVRDPALPKVKNAAWAKSPTGFAGWARVFCSSSQSPQSGT